MHEHPILFSAPMVRAILEGRKTQTRRAAKLNISGRLGRLSSQWHPENPGAVVACPYGRPGDRLWVRETTWLPPSVSVRDLREGADTWPKCIYSADADDYDLEFVRAWRWKRRPSIHMPRWASRITLEITDVRVQRLQDINEEDALSEGVPYSSALMPGGYRGAFRGLWDSINESRGFGWNANPYVWALTFKRVEE